MNKMNRNKVLLFEDFITNNMNLLESFTTTETYVPVAESILSSNTFDLDDEQRCILEFVSYNKLNINQWILLKTNESWFDNASKWFQEKIINPIKGAAKSAINWLVELGSNITNAIKSVVDKIMNGVQDVWEMVKVETSKWFSGNKSLKRQMTIAVNQQMETLKESLILEDNKKDLLMASLSKETGQLSNMFVESINKVIKGEAFASRVTLSINKAVQETKPANKILEKEITYSVFNMIPDAINEGVLDSNKLKLFGSNSKRVKSFNEVQKVNEVFEIIDKFYDWCISILDKLPPFNLLNDFVKNMEKNGNQVLDDASKFLTDTFGVPGPYKFEALGPIFSVLISVMVQFGKFYLVNKAIGFVVAPIPIIGPIVMFLLSIYGFWILGEIIMDVFNSIDGESQVQTQEAK
jgi:hypothetical protein